MSTVVDKIAELQKQQASIAVTAREKYNDLIPLLSEWENLQIDVSKKPERLQRIVAEKIEQLHNDLLSILKEWGQLESQIYEIVQDELQEIKGRVLKIKEIPKQPPPAKEHEPNDDDDNEAGHRGIGA